jgi:DmsE family decaheme c-type cytochrome
MAAYGQQGAGNPISATPEGFTGSEPCKRCHPGVWAFFFRNAHFKSEATKKPGPDHPDGLPTGCESCHGPAKRHLEENGGKKSIRAFSQLTPKATLDACLTCHAKQFPRANIRRSPHSTGEVACTSCHSIHKAATPKYLLAKAQPEGCYGCHLNVRAQFSMPFKHRVNEGFMQCTDCHNPHGTASPVWRMGARPKLVDQALVNEEACLKCHVDQRGPFAFEHAGVRVEGCETCHIPHGSPNARLLKRPQVFTLCLECHNGAGTFGRQADGVALPSPSHSMTNPRYQNCTACHVRIHGSNADQRFLR